jgi:2-iminobutanoate/2-iminopropanoate deaminase
VSTDGSDRITSPAAPRALGPYAQAVAAGDLVFCSGQVGLDPASGALVAGGIAAETGRACENLAAVLAAAGLGLADVVKTTVYLADLAEFAAMNEVYARHFPPPHPARATVQVARLPAGARVEIDAIAVRPAPAA